MELTVTRVGHKASLLGV